MDTDHSVHATGAASLENGENTDCVRAEVGQLERFATLVTGEGRASRPFAKPSSTARKARRRLSDKVPLVVLNELGNKLPVSAQEAALVVRLLGPELLKLFEAKT